MKSNHKIAAAMLAGVALGAVAVQGLHAQAKPPLYSVAEIDVSNLDAYLKEYVPLAQAAMRAHPGRGPKYNCDRRHAAEIACCHSTVGKH